MTDEQLNSYLAKALRYPAVVYAQSYDGPEEDGEFTIDYPFDETPKNAIFFLAPCKKSVTRETDTESQTYDLRKNGNVLRLRKIASYRYDAQGKQIPVFSYEYFYIMCEDPNGNVREAKAGDIVPRRLAILRIDVGVRRTVNTREMNVAILSNSPLYGDAVVLSGITVHNEAVFHLHDGKAPSLVLNEQTGEKTYLAREDEITALSKRISRLEGLIRYGTASPEDALRDADDGTLYIKISED